MTSDQYLAFASEFASLVKMALAKAEGDIAQDAHAVAKTMPALISLVNSVGYLRGQDSILVDFTPEGTDRKPLYAAEDECENRLNKLISTLLQSDEAAYYRQKLENYLVKSRSGEKMTLAPFE